MTTIDFKKLILIGLAFLIAIFLIGQVFATQQDSCNEEFNYTKSIDFADNRVLINYELSDNQIDVFAQPGYQVIEVALDVANDGYNGFHVYSSGPLNSFNPNPGSIINNAKVKVKKVCLSPTVTPTVVEDKIDWCHCEPNGNCQTLNLPQQALQNAGHVDAGGNPLHAGDYPGQCVEPTVTVIPEPTDVPSPTPSPTQEPEPTRTPEATPSPVIDRIETPSSVGVSTPSCPDQVPTKVEDVWVDTGVKNDGQITVFWGQNSNYSKVHIVYTDAEPGNWRYALLDTDNDGSESIGGLQNGVHYWFAVQYVNGCAPGPLSDWVDPLP